MQLDISLQIVSAQHGLDRTPPMRMPKRQAKEDRSGTHHAICPQIEQQKAGPLPFKFSNETGGHPPLTPSAAVPDLKYSKIED